MKILPLIAWSTSVASLKIPPQQSFFPNVVAPSNFEQPSPRPLTVTGDWPGFLSSVLALGFRLGTGALCHGWSPKLSFAPPEMGEYALQLGPLWFSDDSPFLRSEFPRPKGDLILYEFDSSPFCRKVRDAMTILDLEVTCRPCPGAVSGFSDELFALSGKRTVPFFVDEGAEKAMFESEDIIDYLFNTYGPGADAAPATIRGTPAVVSAGAAAIVRMMPAAKMQADARPDNGKMRPLVLYGYEASPFVRPVKEKLCALGLPHTVVNCARGSVKRALLTARTGTQFQVPYLVDLNTGVELAESVDIRIYLDSVYTTSGWSPLAEKRENQDT